MKNLFFLTISILILFSGCTHQVENQNTQTYINDEYNFSVEIPEGPYLMPNDTSSITDVIIGNSGDGSPFAEMNIRIEEGNLDSIEKHPNDRILKEENIEINNVKGKLIHYAYFIPGETEPLEGDGCPVYILDDERGHIFTFREWECMYTPIYEDVVYSFELLDE